MTSMKSVSVAAVMALLATPAFAQHTRGDHGGQSRGGGQAQSRGPSQGQGAPQTHAQPAPRGGVYESRGQAPGAYRGAVPRSYGAPRAIAPNRVYGGGGYASRGYAPRVYEGSRGYGYAAPRAYNRSYAYGGGYRGRVVVPVVPYYRPYYSFRPRLNIGLGVFLGYPVPYPYSYGYPTYIYGSDYGYGTSYAQDPYYADAPPASGPYTNVMPTQTPSPTSYGGVSLDISPADADVFVDGSFVGQASDFSPSYQPLTMTPGRHHIELNAPDSEPLSFDVDVVAGQVMPYRGDLRRN